MTKQIGQYPNTFYRVSLKAIIENTDGNILAVKEHSDFWSFPGGGLDHGESAMEGLLRELKEEVDYDGGIVNHEAVGIETLYVRDKDAYLMLIFYKVKLENDNFSVGPDTHEVGFIDPKTLKGSVSISEQLIYKICVDSSVEILN